MVSRRSLLTSLALTAFTQSSAALAEEFFDLQQPTYPPQSPEILEENLRQSLLIEVRLYTTKIFSHTGNFTVNCDYPVENLIKDFYENFRFLPNKPIEIIARGHIYNTDRGDYESTASMYDPEPITLPPNLSLEEFDSIIRPVLENAFEQHVTSHLPNIPYRDPMPNKCSTMALS